MGNSFAGMNLPPFPLLSEEEIMDLLRKARQGDAEAREKLINCNLRLVFNLVQRFQNRGYDMEDLFQIGTIGLIKAIDKFDFSYGVRFSTYAVPLIIGEIRRFLRDDGPVKVTRSLKETANKVKQVKEKIVREQNREPTIGEIARELNLSREEVVEALEALQSPASFYDTLYQDDGDPIFLLDQLAEDDGDATRLLDRLAVKEALTELDDREKAIILMRFFQDKTQMEVARKLGISQVQVSRLERQALRKIRLRLEGKEEEK